MIPGCRCVAAVLALTVLVCGNAWAEDTAPAQPPKAEGAQIAEPDTVRGEPAEAWMRPTPLDAIMVTALRREELVWDAPASVSVLDERTFIEQAPRTLPDVLDVAPGVMVQKTSYGQASPYVRGLTGFHVLHLIDGIRLNNSVFRSGPNQYFSTIDPLVAARLELVRGPSSVLFGSDAVGGVINVISKKRTSFEPGFHMNGAFYGRYASAEDSAIGRVEIEGNAGTAVGFYGGFSLKHFNDLEGGRDTGVQEYSGYDEMDGDFRFDFLLRDDVWLTVAWQHVEQDDVPRTHTTVYGIPFHGTELGTELRRQHDQTRDLAYTRLAVDGFLDFFDRAELTLSFHRQDEERDRLRTGARRDLSGFTVNTFGADMQFEKQGSTGIWTFGTDYYHDDVDSFRRDYVAGTLTLDEIQGPIGDDAEYSLWGAYVQNEHAFGEFDLITGLRYTRAVADADQVDNPLVGGSDPATPGNVLSISEEYGSAVGSVRGVYHLEERWNLFGGVSQGFRAPNLSDLTTFDATSAVETPSPDLEPENFLEFELGVRARYERFSGQVAVWKTLIDDMIVESPTGDFIGGDPEVQKDNVGDGWLHGFEAEGSYRVAKDWEVLGMVAWMDGEIDQFLLPSGQKVSEPVSRMLPLSGRVSLKYDPVDASYWAMFETVMADNQDKLSLKDETDTERIPPGGTPGYTIYNLRGGIDLTRDVSLTLAVENITNKDYRIHGSGVNEPGTNFVASLWYRF